MPTDREILDSRRSQDRHYGRDQARLKPFAGADGEGGDVDGRHEYLLLRCGDHVLETGKPLTTFEILRFLCDLPRDVIYVSYFFDYDVTMILRALSPERLNRLLDVDCRRIPEKPCSSFPINVGSRYQIDYMPRKEFRVRRRVIKGDKLQWGPWLIINDTGSFFQARFTTALRGWFPEEQYTAVIDKIEEGKEQRHEFGHVTEYEREYNTLECVMLAKLMERFREMTTRNNIRPMKWQGPGNLVSAVMKREKLPRNKDLTIFETNPAFVMMANDGYYGGRFETAQFGAIPGPVYQYDINSAYADTYRRLPCLLHGRWVTAPHMPLSGIFVGRVSFKHHGSERFCTLPVRAKEGTLMFPVQAQGTYWSPELLVARDHAQIWWKEGWQYVQECECSSFDWVYQIYDERKRLGKDIAGKVLKIVLASTYGKLAQSVGCAPYSNPIWASLIVSNVRATLIRAALSGPRGANDVCMLATDGIFCREPRTLPLGTELGEWTQSIHPDMFAVQSGIYFIDGQKPKTRGTPQKRVEAYEQEFRNVWSHFLETGELGSVTIPLNVFIGLRLALARNKPETAGMWVDIEKEIKFDWASKRMFEKVNGTTVETMPIRGSAQLASEPYSRAIGGIRVAERLLLADQPEWGQQL